MDRTLCVLPASTTTIETCEQEEIHTPNVIQAHGAVLVADAASHRITHASANLEQILGRSAHWAIGRQLSEVVGKAAVPLIDPENAEGAGSFGDIVSVYGSGDRTLNLLAHRTGSRIFIDLQPTMVVNAGSPMPVVNSVLESFMGASTRDELGVLAARGLRSVSGFDRVMVYRFGPNGDGQIVAESKIDALGSLLGMTYPAADIPPQARALFLLNRVGAIADTSYAPVPLLADQAYSNGEPLDMTRSTLRGISPIHCEYLRNMNVAASLTISIVHRDVLVGMLVCHHTTPRVTGPELRSVAKLLGQVLSLLVGSLSEAEAYAERLKHQRSLQSVTEAIASDGPILHGLRRTSDAVLDLVDAGAHSFGYQERSAGSVLCLHRRSN